MWIVIYLSNVNDLTTGKLKNWSTRCKNYGRTTTRWKLNLIWRWRIRANLIFTRPVIWVDRWTTRAVRAAAGEAIVIEWPTQTTIRMIQSVHRLRPPLPTTKIRVAWSNSAVVFASLWASSSSSSSWLPFSVLRLPFNSINKPRTNIISTVSTTEFRFDTNSMSFGSNNPIISTTLLKTTTSMWTKKKVTTS